MGFQWEFLKDESMRAGEHMKQITSHKYSSLFFFNLLFILGCAGSLGCMDFSLAVVSQGYSLVAMLLVSAASLDLEDGLFGV